MKVWSSSIIDIETMHIGEIRHLKKTAKSC